MVLVLPERVAPLREALLDVAAHDAVSRDRDVLIDRVAMRELTLRLREAQATLNQLIEANYGAGYGQWFVAGQLVDMRDRRQFDAVLSAVFDQQFAATPLIRSELIVRRKLSGSISRARRQLIELILEQSHRPLLGLTEGYPPERALYESILRAGQVHVAVTATEWQLQIPTADNDPLRFGPIFAAIDDFFTQSIAKRLPLTALYTVLLAPPFGVREPLIPLFFVLMYVIHSGEVALYEHDSFVAIPDVALFERLVVKPQHFAVRRSPASGLRTALFERVAKAFAPQALTKRGTLAVLDAVKPMLRFAQQLPAYVRQTQTLSPQTMRVRHALLEAKAPDDLLYIQIPTALGLPPIAGDAPLDDSVVEAVSVGLRTALEELQQAYPALVTAAITAVAQAVYANTHQRELLHAELHERTALVLTQSADPQLRAFANRIHGSDALRWIESVAALLGRKPMPSWSDADVDTYRVAVADVGRRLRLFEQVATAQTHTHLGALRRRVGISDARGERSLVVTFDPNDSAMQAIRQQIDAMLAQSSLDSGQRLSVLVGILESLLPNDTQMEDSQ